MKSYDSLKALKKVYDKGGAKDLNKALDDCTLGALTLEEISLVLGMTRERVRQIELTAMRKLSHPRVSRELKRYMALTIGPELTVN